MDDRDKLKEKIARAISREDGIMAGEASDFSEWHWEESLDHAEAALAALEEAGFVIVSRETAETALKSLRMVVDDCQANTGIKGETSSPSAIQSKNTAEAFQLLKRGDVIQKGDQPLDDNCVDWIELSGWEIGMEYFPEYLKPVRRRIEEPSDDTGTPANFEASLTTIEKDSSNG